MPAETLNVVMVEDDEGHATLVKRNLKRAGLLSEPVHLRDGQELLDYIYHRAQWSDRGPLDSVALLLDLNMPRLNGTEVLERLKDDEVLSRIPVFVLTTTDNPIELDRCYALGAAACIVKPLDYGAFSTIIFRLGEFLMSAALPDEHPPHLPSLGA